MACVNELIVYQEKLLKTAELIVQLDRDIASTTDFAKRERLQGFSERQRVMLRAFEGMVSFLNCCIEIERRETLLQAVASKRAQRA